MQVIIRPTNRCNFNCTFCSAGLMDKEVQHPIDGHVPKEILDFLVKIKPSSLIITGGDPLMVPPDYYYELHGKIGVPIGATTNLKDFYLYPEKWTKLFNESWFNVTTSFNYGNTRLWDPNTIYSEEMFLKVMNKYSKYVNKKLPMFIAVIDKNNEDTIFDLVYLAKKLDTITKINGAVKCGKQETQFPRYRLYKYYTDIIDLGLGDYEDTCRTRAQDFCNKNINRLCISTIRCIYLGTDGKLHVGTCDEQLSMKHELSEDKWFPDQLYTESINQLDCINPKECSYCELFSLCNGCRSNRNASKDDPNYCSEMKLLKDKLIEQGWLL